jgi:hypothetical protein
MRRLIIISLPLLVCFAACAGRDRRNVNCQAPQETPFRSTCGIRSIGDISVMKPYAQKT